MINTKSSYHKKNKIVATLVVDSNWIYCDFAVCINIKSEYNITCKLWVNKKD